jgi:hypothetical protein
MQIPFWAMALFLMVWLLFKRLRSIQIIFKDDPPGSIESEQHKQLKE